MYMLGITIQQICNSFFHGIVIHIALGVPSNSSAIQNDSDVSKCPYTAVDAVDGLYIVAISPAKAGTLYHSKIILYSYVIKDHIGMKQLEQLV